MAIAMCLDCVFSSLHVCGSGCFAMAISSIGTCGTGVGAIETKSICPTVEHLDTIIHDEIGCASWHHCHWGWQCSLAGSDDSICTVDHRCSVEIKLCNCHGDIGAVETELQGCEFAKAFFIFVSKVLVEFNQCLICQGLDMPHVTGCGENTRGFEHE